MCMYVYIYIYIYHHGSLIPCRSTAPPCAGPGRSSPITVVNNSSIIMIQYDCYSIISMACNNNLVSNDHSIVSYRNSMVLVYYCYCYTSIITGVG